MPVCGHDQCLQVVFFRSGEDGRCRQWLSIGLCCAQLYLTLCDPLDCSPPGSSVPFPPPGDLPKPGIKPKSLVSPALAGRFPTTEPPGKPGYITQHPKIRVLLCCSVAKLCPTLCDPMDFNASDFPVHCAFETSFAHSQNPSISIPP